MMNNVDYLRSHDSFLYVPKYTLEVQLANMFYRLAYEWT